MKVGIITLFEKNYNYGGVLQAYALRKYISRMGHDVDVIRFTPPPSPSFSNSKGNKVTKLCNRIKNKLGRISSFEELLWELKKLINGKHVDQKVGEAFLARKKCFDEFISKNITTSIGYNATTIEETNGFYDFFVCGSDQIWKPECTCAEYFLSFFSKKDKTMAYAASLGVSHLGANEKKFIYMQAQNVHYVSVRENRGKELLDECGIQNAETVVDPTFLLSVEDWTELAGDKPIVEGEYIFVYFLTLNYKALKKIRKFADLTGKKIVSIAYLSGRDLCGSYFSDIELKEVGPKEFLNLIKYATNVCTDSFHGCVFSIIFGTPFNVFSRNVSASENMNSRLETLLGDTKAQMRMTTADEINTLSDDPNAKSYYNNIIWKVEQSKKFIDLMNSD